MKKSLRQMLSLFFTLSLILAMTTTAFAAQPSVVKPMYIGISNLSAHLKVSSAGLASCGATLYNDGDYTVDVTILRVGHSGRKNTAARRCGHGDTAVCDGVQGGAGQAAGDAPGGIFLAASGAAHQCGGPGRHGGVCGAEHRGGIRRQQGAAERGTLGRCALCTAGEDHDVQNGAAGDQLYRCGHRRRLSGGKGHAGCYFIGEMPALRKPEIITAAKEFCDCVFAWNAVVGGACGRSEGRTLPAYPEAVRVVYPRTQLTAENAAKLPCEQVLGAYTVTFER